MKKNYKQMSLFKLVALGAQDAYLTGNSNIKIYSRLELSKALTEFEREFGTKEAVQSLDEELRKLKFNSWSVRGLLCQSRYSPASPFYGMDLHCFQRIVADVVHWQFEEIVHLEQKLDRALKLLARIAELEASNDLKSSGPGPFGAAAAQAV